VFINAIFRVSTCVYAWVCVCCVSLGVCLCVCVNLRITFLLSPFLCPQSLLVPFTTTFFSKVPCFHCFLYIARNPSLPPSFTLLLRCSFITLLGLHESISTLTKVYVLLDLESHADGSVATGVVTLAGRVLGKRPAPWALCSGPAPHSLKTYNG
jgi:hypothetical protein